MTNIKQDKYILGQSMDGSIVNVAQELRIDLTLEDNPIIATAEIYGTITDNNNIPIKNALVKLVTSSYEPVSYTFTNVNGYYSFNNLSTSISFIVLAIADGTDLVQSNSFTIGPSMKKEVNLVLTYDNVMSLSVIAGDIIDSVTSSPINEAVVSLFSDTNGTLTLIGIAYTNEYGQYTFRELPKGNYVIKVSALGYNDSGGTIAITKDGQVISFNVPLTKNPITSNSTISGVILDTSNIPIAQGQVILYRVESQNSSQSSIYPIAFTTTNENGVYLFGNVSLGSYVIAANQIEIITIPVESDGTVSGIILDSSNNPIANADVILCQLLNEGTSNETNIPISYTTTDANGAYLFKDVPIGTFLVKATKVTPVTIS